MKKKIKNIKSKSSFGKFKYSLNALEKETNKYDERYRNFLHGQT